MLLHDLSGHIRAGFSLGDVELDGLGPQALGPQYSSCCFAAFSDQLGDQASLFFENDWIDAPIRPRKRGGAFCHPCIPSSHPYLLLNFEGHPRDVMTLAHELGHGVHDILARSNHLLDYHAVLPLAETASTFAEMLLFDRLLGELDSDRERLALLCSKIEDTFATVFRQVAMFRFEQEAHQARRERGELTTEAFSALWQDNIQAMFGSSLELGDDHACWWLYIPHIISTPFYVYAYAFGELLVLSLYAQYQREGAGFVDRYFDLLAGGGSRGVLELSIGGGRWDAVCDDSFGSAEADVFCRELGFTGGNNQAFSGSTYDTTHGDGSFAADNIQCPEGAESISECSSSRSPYSDDCSASETVGIECSGTYAPAYCAAGSCTCEGSFIGEFCETECGCSGHGNQTAIGDARSADDCSAGACTCEPGYLGEFCETYYPPIDLSTVPAQCAAGMGSHGVVYNGAAYRTLDDAPPEGGRDGDPNGGCQCTDWSPSTGRCTGGGNNYLPLPAGWVLAPNDATSIAVVAAHGWSTSSLVLADGVACYTSNSSSHSPGTCPFTGPQHHYLATSGGTYTVTACHRRVLARCG